MLTLFSSGIIMKKEIMVADIPKSVARIKTVEIDMVFLLNIKIVQESILAPIIPRFSIFVNILNPFIF